MRVYIFKKRGWKRVVPCFRGGVQVSRLSEHNGREWCNVTMVEPHYRKLTFYLWSEVTTLDRQEWSVRTDIMCHHCIIARIHFSSAISSPDIVVLSSFFIPVFHPLIFCFVCVFWSFLFWFLELSFTSLRLTSKMHVLFWEDGFLPVFKTPTRYNGRKWSSE